MQPFPIISTTCSLRVQTWFARFPEQHWKAAPDCPFANPLTLQLGRGGSDMVVRLALGGRSTGFIRDQAASPTSSRGRRSVSPQEMALLSLGAEHKSGIPQKGNLSSMLHSRTSPNYSGYFVSCPFFFFFLLQTIQLCDGILTGAKSLCVVESDIYGKISSMTRILIHVHPNMQFHAFISLMFLQLGPGFAVILFSEGALQCAIWEAVFSL